MVPILNGLSYLYPDKKLISDLKRTLAKYPHSQSDFNDAFSIGQLKSKIWLIENLPDNLGLVFMCGGWYGILAYMMAEHQCDYNKIRSFDINPDCAKVADELNKNYVINDWSFKATTTDILDISYPYTYNTLRGNGTEVRLVEWPDTIINTSSEHIKDFDLWYDKIPIGTLVVLQCNDYMEIEDHVNCMENQEELDFRAPMADVYFIGTLQTSKYNRFMKIGWK